MEWNRNMRSEQAEHCDQVMKQLGVAGTVAMTNFVLACAFALGSRGCPDDVIVHKLVLVSAGTPGIDLTFEASSTKDYQLLR